MRFMLTPLDSGVDQSVSIDAWTIRSVCAPLTAVDVDVRKCAHLRNLKLADTFPRKAAPVDLLVGADQYYKSKETLEEAVQEHRSQQSQDWAGF